MCVWSNECSPWTGCKGMERAMDKQEQDRLRAESAERWKSYTPEEQEAARQHNEKYRDSEGRYDIHRWLADMAARIEHAKRGELPDDD
jgi:hypothetical protein